MVFIYTKIIDFPDDDFVIPNIVTEIFFESVNNVMIVKIHLHHLHVTGKIHDYAHNICNW